jgi:hypothetical protein
MYTRWPSSLVDFMWKSVAEMLTSHIIVKSENQNPRFAKPHTPYDWRDMESILTLSCVQTQFVEGSLMMAGSSSFCGKG